MTKTQTKEKAVEPTMSDELKPCPFCGPSKVLSLFVKPLGEWSVFCQTCGVSCYGKNKEQAIAAWNRRALPNRDALLRIVYDVADEEIIKEGGCAVAANRILALLEGKSALPPSKTFAPCATVATGNPTERKADDE